MMLSGIGTVLIWRFGLGLTDGIYDAMPGMLMGFFVYGLGSWRSSPSRSDARPG